MIKIIDGVEYDSDKGFQIGSRDIECYPFNCVSWTMESLIRSPDGHFFLYTEWSAQSKMGKVHGKCGGDITPLDDMEKARTWLRSYGLFENESQIDDLLDPKQWEFPKHGRSRITVTLSCEIIEALQEDSVNEGQTVSWIIDDALRSYYGLERG